MRQRIISVNFSTNLQVVDPNPFERFEHFLIPPLKEPSADGGWKKKIERGILDKQGCMVRRAEEDYGAAAEEEGA